MLWNCPCLLHIKAWQDTYFCRIFFWSSKRSPSLRQEYPCPENASTFSLSFSGNLRHNGEQDFGPTKHTEYTERVKPRTWLSLASKIAPYRTGPGDRAGADTVTVTCNEILCSLNAPEQYILAIVEIEDGTAPPPHYIRKPFATESDFGVTSLYTDGSHYWYDTLPTVNKLARDRPQTKDPGGSAMSFLTKVVVNRIISSA